MQLLKVDARLKLLIALAALIMVLNYKGFIFPLMVATLCLFLSIKIKVSLRIFALRFCEPLFIASGVLILKHLFCTNYQYGLGDSLIMVSRILGAVSIVVVAGFSIPFTEFISALSWLKVPKDFVEILIFAYRFLFMLWEDAMTIYYAQRNRLGYVTIRRGLGSFGNLCGSLVLKAFAQSQNITTAMIQRGYDGNIPILKHKPFKPREITLSALIVMAMGILWKM